MPTRVNLCTNPSFEVSLAGWVSSGTPTITQDTAGVFVGSKSMLVSSPASVYNGVSFPRYTANGTFSGLTVGQVYTVSGYCTVHGGQLITWQVQGLSTSAANSAVQADGQKRLFATFTATATSHTVTIGNSGGGPATTFNVDGVLLEQASAVGAYFDGDTSGCTWSGTAGLSTSQQVTQPFGITATPDLLNQPPRVALYVAGAPTATVLVTRTDPDGNIRPVRGTEPASTVAGAWIGYDYEAPYGATSLTYTVIPTDSTPQVTSAPVSLPVTQSWLIHPGVPALSVQLNRLKRASRSYPSGTAEHVILGAVFPKTVTDGTRKSGRYQLTVRTDTDAQRTALSVLLSQSVTILLQIAYPFTPATYWSFLNVNDVAEDEVTARFGDPQRLWTLEVTEVDRPAGNVAAQRTYADLLTECATWADVMGRYKTWAGVLTGIPGT
jgi:hypothetical protein